MSWLEGTRARLRLLLACRDAERRMDDEFRFHLDMEAERLVREAGLEPGEARRRARAAFGGVEVHREALRDGRGWAWLRGLTLDLRLARRMLVKQPALTLVAVFALGIGIPVGVLPLHVVDALTTPPPAPDGDEIVILRNYDLAESRPLAGSLQDLARWREELASFEHLGLMRRRGPYNVLSRDGPAAPADGAEFTASMFTLLGARPMLGRPLVEADEAAGAPDVVVIGHGLWQSRLAGDPDVVGRTIRVGAVPRTVVGVMPPEFEYPIRDQLWMPVRSHPLAHESGPGPGGRIVGRLADGVSLEEARREIDFSGRRMAERFPETHARLQPQVLPVTRVLTGIDAPEAGIGVAVGQTLALLVLVLACGNVGILMLARAAARARELALRTALGASRLRICSQLFIESLLLAALAAGVGLAGLQAVATGPEFLVDGLPFWVDFEVSRRTALLALSLAVVSAVAAGVVPALKATGRGVQASIQRAGAGGSGVRFGRGYSALIVGEVAVALWFLAIGSTMAPGALSEPGGLGIPAAQYLHASLRLPQGAAAPATPDRARPDRPAIVEPERDATPATPDRARTGRPAIVEPVRRVHEELVRRLSAEPGVGPVAVADALPGTAHATRYVQVEGLPRADDAPAPAHLVQVTRVDVGYFEALGRPVAYGRDFDLGDLGGDRTAVIVNQGFVDRVLEGRHPLGRRLRYWARGREPGPWSYEIVGVAGSLGMNALRPDADQGVYHVAAPGELHPVSFAVRVGSDPETFIPRLRAIVSEIEPGALMGNAAALDEVPDANRRALTMAALLFVLLAGVAVVLSGSCLYALMSFTVTERTRETGIRTALGAPPASIVLLVGKRALVQLTAGVSIGAALSAVVLSGFGGQAESAFLLPTSWPATVCIVAAFVIAVGMLACARPTLRALRIAPLEAMRPD